MTVNFTNSPNLHRVALTWARLMADRSEGEVQEVRVERRISNDGKDQEDRCSDRGMDGIPDDALCGLRGRQGLE